MGELGVPFCVVFLHNNLMSILQDIFRDHYEEMIYILHPRQSVIDNVDKMINCGDPAFGGAMYSCPHCGKLKFVPFRCHSRFCPTCGNLYAMHPKTAIKYIGRYLGRPVIATSRIDNYDGDFVTFHYNRHEDDAYMEETLPVMEFIERLIRHIPEKHFKMIRYGGIYARHREIDKKLHRAISREKHHIFRSFNQWRTAILSAFGYDPLKCECGRAMLFLELYFNHERVSLEELYEKAMSRSRGRRSSA